MNSISLSVRKENQIFPSIHARSRNYNGFYTWFHSECFYSPVLYSESMRWPFKMQINFDFIWLCRISKTWGFHITGSRISSVFCLVTFCTSILLSETTNRYSAIFGPKSGSEPRPTIPVLPPGFFGASKLESLKDSLARTDMFSEPTLNVKLLGHFRLKSFDPQRMQEHSRHIPRPIRSRNYLLERWRQIVNYSRLSHFDRNIISQQKIYIR